jgi:predicted unusual protein kinase regulating ubiquinone biosynthesis (AarF/ABC1/UbiB family)
MTTTKESSKPRERSRRAARRGLIQWYRQSDRAVPPELTEGQPSREELTAAWSEDFGNRPSPDRLEPADAVSQAAGPVAGQLGPRSVQRSLPVRTRIDVDLDTEHFVGPPMMRSQRFDVGRLYILSRLLVWTVAYMRFFFGNQFDRLLRRGSSKRRAVRAREVIESMGGTAIKVGQQVSLRIDLIPYVYAQELSKMLDQVPPFPTDQAIAIIEKAIGGPLEQEFSAFDPTPIGSASVSCVFQAMRKNGRKVAVKVRRPGIGKLFVADCYALGWLIGFLELITIMRPGLSRNFLYEFRTMLVEELDFEKEARYMELFRRRAKKAKLNFVSAPRVHHDISNHEVLVSEFVSGVFMSEVLAALESKDPKALAELRRRGIKPKKLAERLLQTSQFSVFENILFHADPHPGNIVVRPKNRLVLIDFGSCGAYTERERRKWRQMAHCHQREDVGGMVHASISLLEPLPPIDVDEYSKRLETLFFQDLYAFRSKHAKWWERTSARLWIGFIGLSNEYQIPMHLNTLRIIRSTLLYETVAARLYKKISSYREYRKYELSAAKRARKRVHQRMWDTVTKGDDPRRYLQIEEFGRMFQQGVSGMQRFLDSPPLRFGMMVGKAVFAMSTALRSVLSLAAGFLGGSLAMCLYQWYRLDIDSYTALDAFHDVGRSRIFIIYAVIVVFLSIRRMMFRFGDQEPSA